MRKPWTKLSDEQWREISKRVVAGELQVDLALEFNVTQSTISRVLGGSNRGHLATAHKPCAACGAAFRVSSYRREHCDNAQCVKDRKNAHYAANAEKMRLQIAAARKRQALRVDKLKDVPCMDCGTYYPGEPDLMDFDHRDPDTKNPKLRGRIVNGRFRKVSSIKGLSIADREAEILKCDVVCKICHVRRSRNKGHFLLASQACARRGTFNSRKGRRLVNATQPSLFVVSG